MSNYSVMGKIFVETDNEYTNKTIGEVSASLNNQMLKHHISVYGTSSMLDAISRLSHQVIECENLINEESKCENVKKSF